MKMKRALEFVQADLAAAQQHQEEYANHYRNTASAYQSDAKIWLDLHDIWTDCTSKKLDA